MRTGLIVIVILCLASPAVRAQDGAAPPAGDGADSPHELDEIVVTTAGRRAQSRSDAVVATEVIDRETLRDNGAENVAEALEDLPGIEIIPALQGSTVRMQGLDPQHTLILIDGEPVIGRSDGALDLTRIALQDVERIEIVRGASSALYGSAAHGGVINIITRRGSAPFAMDGRLSLGTYDPYALEGATLDLGLGAAVRRRDFRARVDAGVHRVGAYDLDPSDVATTGSEVTQYDGALSLGQHVGNTDLGLRLRLSRRDLVGIDASATGAVYDRHNRIDEVGLGGTLATEFARGTFATQVYFTQFRDQFVLDQRGSAQEDLDQTTRQRLGEVSAQYAYVSDDGRHTLTLGADVQQESLLADRLSRKGHRTRVAPFAQYEWVAQEDVNFVVAPGLRVDVDSQFGAFASPKLALRLDPHESLVLRGSAGRGFRAPNFKELYLSFENPSVGYRVIGNPSVHPETSWSFQLEGEWQATEAVGLRVSLYRNQIDDLIDTQLDETAANVVYTYVNTSSAITQGSELSVRLRPARGLDLQLTYVFLDARDLQRERALSGRPRHRGTFRVRYAVPGTGFSAVVRGSVVGERPFYETDASGDTQEVRDDPYLSLDARVEQTLGDYVAVFAGADNLAGAGGRYLNIRPRGFYAGLRLDY
ncbi:MAG: TonB-dependent receptor [Sandaracinaceae bacterium]|nr:TonB-dependent receptor [Sandaracinaceae bacterium]